MGPTVPSKSWQHALKAMTEPKLGCLMGSGVELNSASPIQHDLVVDQRALKTASFQQTQRTQGEPLPDLHVIICVCKKSYAALRSGAF